MGHFNKLMITKYKYAARFLTNKLPDTCVTVEEAVTFVEKY